MIVTFLAQARHDLDAIWSHVAADDPDAADRLIDRIHATSRRLASFPESGPARPEIGDGIRSLTVGRYLLLYRVGSATVEVARVLHGARDILAALREMD